jgi:hypothetical protein
MIKAGGLGLYKGTFLVLPGKIVQTTKFSLFSTANFRRILRQDLLNMKQKKCNSLDCGVQWRVDHTPISVSLDLSRIRRQSPVASTDLVLAVHAYVTSYSPNFTTLGVAWLSYLTTLSVKGCIASVNSARWWHDTDGGNPKYLNSPSQWHFVHHKPHTEMESEVV